MLSDKWNTMRKLSCSMGYLTATNIERMASPNVIALLSTVNSPLRASVHFSQPSRQNQAEMPPYVPSVTLIGVPQAMFGGTSGSMLTPPSL